MPKHILLSLMTAAIISTPAFAQSAKIESQAVNALDIDADSAKTIKDDGTTLLLNENVTLDFGYKLENGYKPEIEPQIKNAFEIGASYRNSVKLNDSDSSLILDDVATLDFGYRAERELIRGDAVSLSGALSQEASFGRVNEAQLNGTQVGGAEFRRLGAYADVIARLEGETESDWTPFISAGVGVVQDRVKVDDEIFKDLSPVGRYRAGLEKKINDTTTFGIGVGQSFKLD